jgi:hypothetical protein
LPFDVVYFDASTKGKEKINVKAHKTFEASLRANESISRVWKKCSANAKLE